MDKGAVLQIPANLADANAPTQNLSFTLTTTKETLGNTVGAPVVFHPVFKCSNDKCYDEAIRNNDIPIINL